MNTTSDSAARGTLQNSVLEWFEALVFAVSLLVIVFSFVLRITLVDGSSMCPTLYEGDRLIVWGAGYEPQQGDVIILDKYSNYGVPLVKRIIGMPGDVIDIDFEQGTVSVNGTVLDEPYIAEATHLQGDVAFPLTVPENAVFVMGDNRNGSKDSRMSEVGCIDTQDILGKVVFRIYPFSEAGIIQ